MAADIMGLLEQKQKTISELAKVDGRQLQTSADPYMMLQKVRTRGSGRLSGPVTRDSAASGNNEPETRSTFCPEVPETLEEEKASPKANAGQVDASPFQRAQIPFVRVPRFSKWK